MAQRKDDLGEVNSPHGDGAVLKTCTYLFCKRCIDIVGAGIALLLIGWLGILTAIIIKLTSRGPVFYRQTRLGKDCMPFQMLKFRSMYEDADERRKALEEQNEADGPVFKIRNDPRITPIGRFIRKYSIDELPQLWHVLLGTMSLVGPRPPIPAEVENYEDWQLQRLTVKPGLTCIWQVSGRSDVGFDDWVRMDIEYIENRSLLLDIKLLLLTIPAVFGGRGAY